MVAQLTIDKASTGRQWIKDDFKICFCAKSIPKIDVVLTGDKNTFLPICYRMLLGLSTTGEKFSRNLLGSLNLDTRFTI